MTSHSMQAQPASPDKQTSNIFGGSSGKNMRTDVGHKQNERSPHSPQRVNKMMMRRNQGRGTLNDHDVVQGEVEEPRSDIQVHLPQNQAADNVEKRTNRRDTATHSDSKYVEGVLSDFDEECDADNVPNHQSHDFDDEVIQESYREDPSSDFTFLNISEDSEESGLHHPFDEDMELSVSSDEEEEENDNSNPLSGTNTDDEKNISPTKSVETHSSNGDTLSTESTTSLSSVDSPRNTTELGSKAGGLPATKPPTPAVTSCVEPNTRQEPYPQRNYHQPSASRTRRPSNNTPCSFRSKRFQQYLVSFHNQDPEQWSLLEHPPSAAGNMHDRFESVLDRPFRYWKAMDQVLEYSHPEWLTHQRGRMIHHLIHFLELKVGFQDYAVDTPPPQSHCWTDGYSGESIPLTIRSGGGQLMPSPVVDEAWRALVLESTLYEEITRDLQEFHGQPIYQYIHYSRVKTMMNSGCRTQGIPEELTTTQSLYQIYFREFMPASIRQVRTTPANRIHPSASTPSTSSYQATKNRIQSTQHYSKNNHWRKHSNAITGTNVHALNSSQSEGNLRGLECLNGSEEPTTSTLVPITKKRVLWC